MSGPSLKTAAAFVELGGRTVLENFSVEIKPGDFIAVVGPNGAGKSTALRTLAGLIMPLRGEVMLNGTPLQLMQRRDIGREIAYLPQDRTVYWPLVAERVVALGRLPHRTFSAAESGSDKTAVLAAMKRMDVLHLAQRPIVTLSGGERARVLVARALAQEARYLIADEPTAGLDPAHCLHLFQEFARLAAEGHAVVTAMHDLSLALRFAKRVILMKDGGVIADGLAASVLKKNLIAQAFGIETIVTTIEGIPLVLPASPLT
jgi:iron complex transport system ATP-binding protein